MKRFLIIGHDATRTGAPMLLLHFLRWSKVHNPDWKTDLLLLCGGELEDEYRKVADVFVLPQNPDRTILRRGIGLLKRKTGVKPKSRVPKLPPFHRTYDTVIGNTVVALEHLEFFKQKGFTTVCWVHELEYTVKSFFSLERFIEISNNADKFIIGSKAVGKFLKDLGIKKETNLVYDFSDTPDPGTVYDTAAEKKRLGIPDDAFVVLGSGTIEWRKGIDLFLQIAVRITAAYPHIYFVWVGGEVGDRDLEYDRIQYDFKRLDLDGRVIFVDSRKDFHAFFAVMNVFALTSREDPFPLVCLEAAALGKPIICFENSGGMPEFVEDDAGLVVSYGNLSAFCDGILHYYNNRAELKAAGQRAKIKITSDFSLEISCQKVKEIILGRNQIELAVVHNSFEKD